ncbi:hypothetical protein Glove_261g14 [Diversispora epigaea]|uniref:Uncharacterized protein n=1 Tax=Diversispora epigaea TaxID=1348612 RepID=A0A397IEI4_9GLOM|nr:hypothetical protein Glove_261g14 [Diversispora epigaea]
MYRKLDLCGVCLKELLPQLTKHITILTCSGSSPHPRYWCVRDSSYHPCVKKIHRLNESTIPVDDYHGNDYDHEQVDYEQDYDNDHNHEQQNEELIGLAEQEQAQFRNPKPEIPPVDQNYQVQEEQARQQERPSNIQSTAQPTPRTREEPVSHIIPITEQVLFAQTPEQAQFRNPKPEIPPVDQNYQVQEEQARQQERPSNIQSTAQPTPRTREEPVSHIIPITEQVLFAQTPVNQNIRKINIKNLRPKKNNDYSKSPPSSHKQNMLQGFIEELFTSINGKLVETNDNNDAEEDSIPLARLFRKPCRAEPQMININHEEISCWYHYGKGYID